MWWYFGCTDDAIDDRLDMIEASLRKILFLLTPPGRISKTYMREETNMGADVHYYAIAMPPKAKDDTRYRELICYVDAEEVLPKYDPLPEGAEALEKAIRLPNADDVTVVLGFPQGSFVDVALFNVDDSGQRSMNPATIGGWEIVDNNPPEDPSAMTVAFVREEMGEADPE